MKLGSRFRSSFTHKKGLLRRKLLSEKVELPFPDRARSS